MDLPCRSPEKSGAFSASHSRSSETFPEYSVFFLIFPDYRKSLAQFFYFFFEKEKITRDNLIEIMNFSRMGQDWYPICLARDGFRFSMNGVCESFFRNCTGRRSVLKNTDLASAPISRSLPVSLNLLESMVGLVPSTALAKRAKIINAEVVFEIEFLKVLTDRVVGKIWFLGTPENKQAVQGEGFILIPIRRDAIGNGFTILRSKAPVVANRFGEFGNVLKVVRGMLTIESLSTDDTKIRTGFGRMTIAEAPSAPAMEVLATVGGETIALMH